MRFRLGAGTKNVTSDTNVRIEGERVPENLDSKCLGSDCPNWRGEKCASFLVWASANATHTEGRDTSKPPFADEAVWVEYDQQCLADPEGPSVVFRKIQVYQNPDGDMLELVGVTNRNDDVPTIIAYNGLTTTINPIDPTF